MSLNPRIENLLRIQDSIVIVSAPDALKHRISNINRMLRAPINQLMRAATYGKNDDLIRSLQEARMKLAEIARKTWEKLGEVYPYALSYNISSWRLINDSYEFKRSLVENHGRRALIIIPYIEEVGMLATVIKHIGLLGMRAKHTGDAKLAMILGEVKREIINAIDEVIEKISEHLDTDKNKKDTA